MASPTRITLAGSLGSGKSSVGKLLSDRLGIEFVSTGAIFRSIGQVKNLTALQTNLEAESNSEIDNEVDSFIKTKSASNDSFIMDSRMAWHFVPHSLKVYLYASYEIAALRVQNDKTRSTESYTSKENAKVGLKNRRESEIKRYKRLYSVDIDDLSNYNLVIVSDSANIEDIADIIIEALTAQKAFPKYWIAKSRIVPMLTIRELSGVSHVTRPEARICLNACLEDGFAFVFEEPYKLAQVLILPEKMVCFENRRPSYLPSDCSLMQEAQLFSASHFYDWDEVGNIDLEITSRITLPSNTS